MYDRRFDVDEDAVKDLARSIERGDKAAAFLALDVLFRDHSGRPTIQHWVDCGRDAA